MALPSVFWRSLCFYDSFGGADAGLIRTPSALVVDPHYNRLVAVEWVGRHWLLARHRGRAALISSHDDERNCRMEKRLTAVRPSRSKWVMRLDLCYENFFLLASAGRRIEALAGLSPHRHR